MKTLTIKEKSVYGNTLFYPYCENSVKFSNLLGKNTFCYRDIEHIKQLGYEINIIPL